MRVLLSLFLLFTLIISTGCVVINLNTAPIPAQQTGYDTGQETSASSQDFRDEEWIHIETFKVPAKGQDAPDYITGPVNSSPLRKGVPYQVRVSGTYEYNNAVSWGVADAEWSNRQGDPVPGKSVGMWYKGDPFEPYLDLIIDEEGIDWGTFRPSHVYTLQVVGKGKPLSFRIVDTGNGARSEGSYFDNSGSLAVDIYEKKLDLFQSIHLMIFDDLG